MFENKIEAIIYGDFNEILLKKEKKPWKAKIKETV